jgi:phosphatidylinositol alpha-mannosyltransferase
MAESDVLCAPSLEGESFGLVLVEGMAAGLPVIASAIPGYVDVLPPSSGVLVPPGSVEALAAALEGLIVDAPRRQELGAAGRREAVRFDWSVVGEEILAVYAQVLHAGARPQASVQL